MYMVFNLNIVFTLGSENLETCMFTNSLYHVVCCRVLYHLSQLRMYCVSG